MMDPLSALTIAGAVGKTAKAAWDVGEALHNLIQGVKVIDDTVQTLAAEAKLLGDVCQHIQNQLERLGRAG